MPLNPPQVNPPLPTISGDAVLLARISALEARLAAIEQVIKIGPEGLTIRSSGNLTLSTFKDCVLAVDGRLAITSKRSLEIRIAGSSLLESQNTSINCGASAIEMADGGNVSIRGTKVSVVGSGDVVIKGQKILQN